MALEYRDEMTTQMKLVTRLYAASTSVDTTQLRRVHSSIPGHAQVTVHGGHYEHLPLLIFANTAADASNTCLHGLYENPVSGRYENPVSGTVVTHVGGPGIGIGTWLGDPKDSPCIIDTVGVVW
ncbi:hypothetical protein TNCV_3615211 [Trichonephila clavipes]|nr:hypothetical protein TNCV_3615211 [Trichonephila clavipes]